MAAVRRCEIQSTLQSGYRVGANLRVEDGADVRRRARVLARLARLRDRRAARVLCRVYNQVHRSQARSETDPRSPLRTFPMVSRARPASGGRLRARAPARAGIERQQQHAIAIFRTMSTQKT